MVAGTVGYVTSVLRISRLHSYSSGDDRLRKYSSFDV